MIKILILLFMTFMLSIILSFISVNIFLTIKSFRDFKYSETDVKRLTGVKLRDYPYLCDVLLIHKNLKVFFKKYYRINDEGIKFLNRYIHTKYDIDLKEMEELSNSDE